jgi:hypothetical protein
MKLEKIVLVAAFSSLAAMGCSSNDTAGERLDTSDRGAVSADARFTQTVVRLQADGTKQIEIFKTPETPSECDGKALAVETLHINRCLGSAVTLWDQPGGVGNKVCFFASSTSDVGIALNDVPYDTLGNTWFGRNRSFVSGTGGSGGRFWYTAIGPDAGGFSVKRLCAQELVAGAPVTNADVCVEGADSIQLFKTPLLGTF